MNSIAFNKNNIPLTVNGMAFVQNAIALIEKITGLVGGNYICSGCETQGGSITSGYVVVNGEIMSFSGGAIQSHVRVVTTVTEVSVLDATYTKTEKILVWGTGTGQIPWSNFKDAKDLLTKINVKADPGGYIAPVTGDTFDYIANAYPGGIHEYNLASILPASSRFAIIAIEHYYTYVGTYMDMFIRPTSSGSDSNSITIRSLESPENEHQFISLVVPMSSRKFYTEIAGPYIKFKIKVIGYL